MKELWEKVTPKTKRRKANEEADKARDAYQSSTPRMADKRKHIQEKSRKLRKKLDKMSTEKCFDDFNKTINEYPNYICKKTFYKDRIRFLLCITRGL